MYFFCNLIGVLGSVLMGLYNYLNETQVFSQKTEHLPSQAHNPQVEQICSPPAESRVNLDQEEVHPYVPARCRRRRGYHRLHNQPNWWQELAESHVHLNVVRCKSGQLIKDRHGPLSVLQDTRSRLQDVLPHAHNSRFIACTVEYRVLTVRHHGTCTPRAKIADPSYVLDRSLQSKQKHQSLLQHRKHLPALRNLVRVYE